MNFYVVIKGYKPGIFTNWAECKKSINNFSNAIYKKFKNINDAIIFINSFNDKELTKDLTKDLNTD
jgi:ribonuclease HI